MAGDIRVSLTDLSAVVSYHSHQSQPAPDFISSLNIISVPRRSPQIAKMSAPSHSAFDPDEFRKEYDGRLKKLLRMHTRTEELKAGAKLTVEEREMSIEAGYQKLKKLQEVYLTGELTNNLAPEKLADLQAGFRLMAGDTKSALDELADAKKKIVALETEIDRLKTANKDLEEENQELKTKSHG